MLSRNSQCSPSIIHRLVLVLNIYGWGVIVIAFKWLVRSLSVFNMKRHLNLMFRNFKYDIILISLILVSFIIILLFIILIISLNSFLVFIFINELDFILLLTFIFWIMPSKCLLLILLSLFTFNYMSIHHISVRTDMISRNICPTCIST